MDNWRSVEDNGVAPRLTPFLLGSTSAHLDDGTGEPVSTIRIRRLCFWVHYGGLVSREGAFVAPKDSVGALGAMRATTDVVVPCAGLTQWWRGWPLLHDHSGAHVATNSTGDTEVSIHWYGLPT
jgi:hypothetical protein